MGWIIGTAIFLTVALACGVLLRAKPSAREDRETEYDYESRLETIRFIKYGVATVGLIAVIIVISWTALASVHQVPAGHVGVVYQFGGIKGQTGDGLQVIAPWRSIKNATVQVQSFAFTDAPDEVPENVVILGGGLDSFSAETQDVFINARLDIQVSPRDVQKLYREVGPEYVNKIVPQRVAQLFKNETVKYANVDIAPNREVIRAAVEQQIDGELESFSIDVVALLIDNITFDPDFLSAIKQKEIAEQEAQRQENLVAAAQFEADQAIEKARGEGQSILVLAQKQAEANNVLNASLTPQVIQFKALELAFGPDSPIEFALLPTGEGLIIDPSSILNQVPTEGAP